MQESRYSCARVIAALTLSSVLVACSGDEQTQHESWQVVHRNLAGALLSVWGSSAKDVWAVGGDAGDGPLVIHFDGASWSRLQTGTSGDLLWIFGFAGGPIYMGGDGGTVLRYQDGVFERMKTPSSTPAVFGIWGASPDDVWAVGGVNGGATGAFAWHLVDGTWTQPTQAPSDLASQGALWKVYGRGASDAWFVGTDGAALHWDGSALARQPTGVSESLFTVHGDAQTFVTVGGFGTGLILENQGAGWVDRSPPGAAPLIGVSLRNDVGYAVGQFGAVFERQQSKWSSVDTGIALDESLHSVWLDDEGGVWSVGGDVLTKPLRRGVMLHKGKEIAGGLP